MKCGLANPGEYLGKKKKLVLHKIVCDKWFILT